MSNNQYCGIDRILEKYQNNKSSLIAVMQEIQSEYNYLPVPGCHAVDASGC